MAGQCVFKRNIFPHAGMDMRRSRLHTKCTTIYPAAFASFCKFAQITTDHINGYMPFSSQIGRKDAPVTLQTGTDLAQAFVFEDGICSGRA